MSDRLLEVSNLRTWFATAKGTARAVDGVNLSISRGETFALLGESGCGKSMTALSIMRLLPVAGRIVDGEVHLGGRDLLRLPEMAMREVRGRHISMIFQEPQSSLNPVMTVGDQIGETLRRHRGLSGEARHRRVTELLDAVGIPDPRQRAQEYPHQLSGGMKQRVMIAIALAGEPELLVADEPTTALDVTIQAQVLALLRELQRRTGMAVLLITHDLGVVAEMADRVAVMYAGHIVEEAAAADFFDYPAHPYSRKLFASLPNVNKRDARLEVIRGSVPALTTEFKACRFEGRCDFAWSACRSVVPRWLEHAPGHRVRCHLYDSNQAGEPLPRESRAAGTSTAARRGARREPAEALLQVDDLKVHFPIHKGLFKRVVGAVRAVDGVSLEIRAGMTLALVGESGCGKTTAGKGILQLLRPTAGSVRYAGVELTRLAGAALRARRKEVQIIFQDPYSSMNPRMMIGDIIEEGMVAQHIGRTRAERMRRADELLGQVGLDADIKQRYPHEFSGGQRQRICIARALAVEPKLIVCDEPTSALDVSVQAQILNLLQELQGRLALAYLFITHNLSVVEYLAHEVAVMYLGRIVERGTVDEVLHGAKHPYTQALLSAVPVVEPKSKREIIRLGGELPSPAQPPRGCHFHPRCPHAMPRCRESYPAATRFSATHLAHCYLYGEAADEGGARPQLKTAKAAIAGASSKN